MLIKAKKLASVIRFKEMKKIQASSILSVPGKGSLGKRGRETATLRASKDDSARAESLVHTYRNSALKKYI